MLLRTVFFSLLILALDYYVFQAFRFSLRHSSEHVQRLTAVLFWSITVFCVGVVVAGAFLPWNDWPKAVKTYAGAFVFVVTFSKLFVVLFLLTDDIFRGGRWVYERYFNKPADAGSLTGATISRSDFLVRTGLVLGALPFVSLIYGMVRGAYDYQVKKVILKLPGLPSSFSGFKLVHISDLHVGSFVSTAPLEEAVKIINELNADAIVFTGDLVNNRSDEMLPYMDVFDKIRAKHGVFSILGNHDYGDYSDWESDEAKRNNFQQLKNIHRDMGWDLLLNEHRMVEVNGKKIAVIGVENHSAHLRFPRRGDLSKAREGSEAADLKLLLSHDPSHWDLEVNKQFQDIAITFSGHTHGMQFGVEIPGFFKWSPIKYLYKQWAGLYEKGQQYLYVNRGLGFLGYPGRVGILPEVALIELRRPEKSIGAI